METRKNIVKLYLLASLFFISVLFFFLTLLVNNVSKLKSSAEKQYADLERARRVADVLLQYHLKNIDEVDALATLDLTQESQAKRMKMIALVSAIESLRIYRGIGDRTNAVDEFLAQMEVEYAELHDQEGFNPSGHNSNRVIVFPD